MTESKKILAEAEVEAALRRLGEVRREIGELQRTCDEDIAAIRERFRVGAAGLKAEEKALSDSLKGYATGQKKAWTKAGRRSVTLAHGVVGFRQVSRIVPPKDEAAWIARIKELGLTDCIRTFEKVDVEALEKHDDTTIEATGARRSHQDRFFAEPATLKTTAVAAVGS